MTIIGGTTLNTVEATTVHADDDAMNIVEIAPIPALGQVPPGQWPVCLLCAGSRRGSRLDVSPDTD